MLAREVYYYGGRCALGACCSSCAHGGSCALEGLGALDAGSLVDIAAGAGFSGSALQTAVAVALAESGGNPTAYNPETLAKGGTPAGKGSYGLWQIYLRDHPEFEGMNLYDPATNAAAAFMVSSGGANFRPWSTFKSGAYRKFLALIPSSDGIPAGDSSGGDSASPQPAQADAPLSPALFGIPLGTAALLIGAYFLLK